MLAVKQKEKKFNEIFFELFKENKIEIAHAIPKLFPFLESLRDHSFITDRIYDDSYEACRNSVPVETVVYNVLNHLETLFDWSFLCTLFNRTNLKAYPGLREIHKNLETELEDKYFSQITKQDQELATVQPHYEQGADDSCSQGSLTRTPSDFSSPGTNRCIHENCTRPFFMKPVEKSTQNPKQSQEDEVIVISSEDSEGSHEDNESELLELFTWTPGLGSQRDEEGEDRVSWAPERKAFFRKPHLLFPESPLLGDIEEPRRPFSAPYFL